MPLVESRPARRSVAQRCEGRLAQLVRAPALQAGGRRFESCTAHHNPLIYMTIAASLSPARSVSFFVYLISAPVTDAVGLRSFFRLSHHSPHQPAPSIVLRMDVSHGHLNL